MRQALQLFQRAFGSFHPQETAWARGGRFVEAFRPQIEPDGFASAAEVAAEAERHLARVRDVFANADWPLAHCDLDGVTLLGFVHFVRSYYNGRMSCNPRKAQ